RLNQFDPPKFQVQEDPHAYTFLKNVNVPKKPPKLSMPGLEHWEDAFNEIWENLSWNVMAPYKIFKHTWIRPGPAWIGTWLWDNAFHSKIWSLANLDFARHVLDSHVQFQDLNDPFDEFNYGRIPHSITQEGVNGWTQPPLMAWAYWELFKKNGSVTMLEQMFSRLFSYHRWLNHARDFNKDGLYTWVHGFESGLDNAPRYDKVSSLECDAVDFSACVSVQLRSLIYMAKILKDDITARGLEQRKKELDEWINEDLWNDDIGFYFDRGIEGDVKGKFIGPKMISGWYPLFAGIVPEDRLARYLQHLTNPDEFWTKFPVPSVALDEESFDKKMNMWRGPTWINTNYMIIKGLKGYGFRALPGELSFKTLDHVFDVYKKNGIFYEYYSSLGDNKNIEYFDRKREKSGPRPYFAGWTGLCANILLEELLGIEIQHDAIILNPSAPGGFIKALSEKKVSAWVNGIPGWNQEKGIHLSLEFMDQDMINFKIEFSRPLSIHAVDYKTKEQILSEYNVKNVEIEVKNNVDVIAMLSRPDHEVALDVFKHHGEQGKK
ncbi:MAG: amylo-alpha-1,6-glucosidase, partial [Promethearchaeota archaeon]